MLCRKPSLITDAAVTRLNLVALGSVAMSAAGALADGSPPPASLVGRGSGYSRLGHAVEDAGLKMLNIAISTDSIRIGERFAVAF